MTYRLYTFNHVWLSSLQKGLQTAHLVSELFVEHGRLDSCSESMYQAKAARRKALEEWAVSDKTIIMLSGGSCAMLTDWYEQMVAWQRHENAHEGLCLPVSYFCEDNESLNLANTVCGIVLPDVIFDAKVTKNGEVKTSAGVHDQLKVEFGNGDTQLVVSGQEPEHLSDIPLDYAPLVSRAWFVIKLKRFQLAI